MKPFNIVLFGCLAAGVILEVITVTAPARILKAQELDPEELLGNRFYKSVFILSAFYMIGIMLMFIADDRYLRIYATILLCSSIVVWFLKKWLARFQVIIIAESTVCLILLLDTLRKIITGAIR
jgi:hypothetical protein